MANDKAATAPVKQRELSAEEIEQATPWGKWTKPELAMIWKRCLPVGANLEDFQLFLYTCEKRNLNPLLKEAYARLQFSRELGSLQLVIIAGIHGLLKQADLTGQMGGVETSYTESEDGGLLSATVTIWKKDCEHPFKATAYWSEYAGGTPIWASKPRVMLAKVALALCLRLAFAAALAGLYDDAEFHHNDDTPSGPRPAEAAALVDEFAVVETEAETTPEPAVNGVVHTTVVEIAEVVTAPEPREWISPDDAPLLFYGGAQAEHTAEEKTKQKQANRALLQRLLTDIQIPVSDRSKLTNEFCIGYLGEPLPSDPFGFIEPLAVLDQWALHNPMEARSQFLSQPRQLGKKLRAQFILAKAEHAQ